jgi:lipopolysaccharide export system permease protein
VILQRYVLRELIIAFLLAFLAVLAVCLVGLMFQAFRNFAGLGIGLLARILPLAAGYVAPWVLLVASATATTLVYGRLASENELDAMRMSGIHANRFLAPAVCFGLYLTLAGWWLNEYVTPAARYERSITFKESTLLVLKSLPRGNKSFEIGRFELSYTDCVDNRMEYPSLLQYEGTKGDRRLVLECFAPSGSVVFEGSVPRIVLSRPNCTQHDPDGTVHHLIVGNELTVPFELPELARPSKDPDEMGIDELREFAATQKRASLRSRALTAIHSRYAQTFAPLLLVLISAPIGTWVRRCSRLAGMGAALPSLLVFFIAFFIFRGMGERGKLNPVVAGWAADAILAAIAIPLLGRLYRR